MRRYCFFVLFFLIACSKVKENQLEVNFSFSVCPSISVMQLTQVPDESGNLIQNISCTTSFFQVSQDLALIIYGDGNIAIAPIEQGQINTLKEEYIMKTISVLHEEGRIKSKYIGIPGRSQDIVSFPEKTTTADVSLATSFTEDGFLYTLFGSALSQFPGSLIKKNLVFISTYLSTKNLSNLPFIVFDEIGIYYILENYKVNDITANFPEDITLPNGVTEVTISKGKSTGDVDFITPLLFPVFPDINLSSLKKISENKGSYIYSITQNYVKVPVFITDVDNDNKVNFIAFSGGKRYFGKLENLSQRTVFLDVFPPSISDIETVINFVFPDDFPGDITEIYFELYTRKGGVNIPITKEKISKEENRLEINIPYSFISNTYISKIYGEKTSENGDIIEKFERYEISESPYIYYNVNWFRSENFLFEVEKGNDRINFQWRIPFKPKIDFLAVDNVLPDCEISETLGTYLSRDCISAYVEIVAFSDDRKYTALWRIYNLDRKSKISLENLVGNKDLIFDLIGVAPDLKIREISLKYTAFFGNTIITYTKTFRYEQ